MKLKKITALILCFAMLCCTAFALAVTSSAAGTAILNGSYTVKDGKLTLTVTLSENPGINTLVANLAYDSTALTLDTVENGTVFAADNNGSMFDVNKAKNPIILYFEENGIGNITATGTVATLTFTVNQEKENYGLTLSVDKNNTFASGTGYIPEDVEFNTPTVVDGDAVTLGDINNDGKINSQDASIMSTFIAGTVVPTAQQTAAADMNGDGKINSQDASILMSIILG